jgi:hypothetical protein
MTTQEVNLKPDQISNINFTKAETFRNTFDPKLIGLNAENLISLDDDDRAIGICVEMLSYVFPILSEKQVRTFLLGDPDHYNLGGIGSTYSYPAVKTVYDNCVRFLLTGFWVMGFDKFEMRSSPDFNLVFGESSNRTTAVHREGLIFACMNENWHYTFCAIKEDILFSFLSFVVSEEFNKYFFRDFSFSFDDCEFIGSGFSAVNVDLLLEKYFDSIV